LKGIQGAFDIAELSGFREVESKGKKQAEKEARTRQATLCAEIAKF
jgi:hypothetical protein